MGTVDEVCDADELRIVGSHRFELQIVAECFGNVLRLTVGIKAGKALCDRGK